MVFVIAVLLFGVIVLVHEFGHFLLAKLNGVGVVEFSIGMGPRLFSFVKGETRYSIKALPFGGSCAMVGEDGGDVEDPAARGRVPGKRDPKSFNAKPVWARISVIAAGPVFNFILSFLFAMVLVSQVGHDSPVIYQVTEGSPAQEAGLMAGDKITRVNSRKVSAYRDVMIYTASHPGETIEVRYERPPGGSWENRGAVEKRSTVLTPVYDQEYQTYMMGVQFKGYEKVEGIGELLSYSAHEIRICVTSTFDSLRMLFTGKVKADEAFTGPIGLVDMVGNDVKAQSAYGVAAVLLLLSNWGLLISTSLGIMNLLPIPALDGGRLMFLLLEMVRGKPVDPEKEGMVHMAGMMVLMALMVMILFNDIRRIF